MKHTYGGVTIALPGYVVIFDDDAPHPVFHSPLAGGREGCSWWIRRSVCGRVIYAEKDDDVTAEAGFAERHGFTLAARHAVRFARPCATCWPELRRAPGLFPIFGRRSRQANRNSQECLV